MNNKHSMFISNLLNSHSTLKVVLVLLQTEYKYSSFFSWTVPVFVATVNTWPAFMGAQEWVASHKGVCELFFWLRSWYVHTISDRRVHAKYTNNTAVQNG